ncbi:hypothetical protein PINS_up003607 [Pythium insidiosum]|nr:hypothetical protein PINS_up003607 [Pythium insidiosum]
MSQELEFVWQGKYFLISFVSSLDYLGRYPEVVTWYGEEFPFVLNPFLLSKSVLDLAHDRGLTFTTKSGISTQENALRTAVST